MKVFIEHLFINFIILMFSAMFICDSNGENIDNKVSIKDIFACYLLSAGGLYFMLFVIWFIVSHGGHLQPLL